MAQMITLYWRDIPAQVIAERGRGRKREQAKIELHRRFAIAIDAAAMRDGADSTDDYLAEWRRLDCGCRMSHPEDSGASSNHRGFGGIAMLPAQGNWRAAFALKR